MKKDYLAPLESMLEMHGLMRSKLIRDDSQTAWFEGRSINDERVTTHLRLVFKPKLHVLTVHLGWRHEVAEEFVRDALQSAWPAGWAWLSNAGLIQAPCLLLFNLAGHLNLPLGGLPIGGPQAFYESRYLHLIESLSQTHWNLVDSKHLLDRYVADEVPFNWSSGNAAIRIAQIAGLLKMLRGDYTVFDRCSTDRLALIQSDMFSLGFATNWIQSLRLRLVSNASSGAN